MTSADGINEKLSVLMVARFDGAFAIRLSIGFRVVALGIRNYGLACSHVVQRDRNDRLPIIFLAF